MKKWTFLLAVSLLMFSVTSYATQRSEVNKHEQTAVYDVGKVSVETPVLVSSLEQSLIVYPSPAIAANVVRYEKRKFVSHNKKLNRNNYQRYGMANKLRICNKAISSTIQTRTRSQLLIPSWPEQVNSEEETDV